MRNLWYNLKFFWNNKTAGITLDDSDPPKVCEICGSTHNDTTTYTKEHFTICHKCIVKAYKKLLED